MRDSTVFKRRGIAHCVAIATAAGYTAIAINCSLQFHCVRAVAQASAHAWRGTAAPASPCTTFSTPRIPNLALDWPGIIYRLYSSRDAVVVGQCSHEIFNVATARFGTFDLVGPWRIPSAPAKLAARRSSDYAIQHMPWIAPSLAPASIERRSLRDVTLPPYPLFHAPAG